MFSMQLPRCEVEGRIDSSCRSRCHFSRRQPSVLIQLALNAVDVEPASSGGSGLNRLLIFLVLALRPLCAHQAAPNSDAFAHSNDDTLFVWLGRCTGGRRDGCTRGRQRLGVAWRPRDCCGIREGARGSGHPSLRLQDHTSEEGRKGSRRQDSRKLRVQSC